MRSSTQHSVHEYDRRGTRSTGANEVRSMGEDLEEKAELTTTSENQDTGNGARLNSLVRWLRGKKRPAEILMRADEEEGRVRSAAGKRG